MTKTRKSLGARAVQGVTNLALTPVGAVAVHRTFPPPEATAPGGAAPIRIPMPVGVPRAVVRRNAAGALVIFLVDQSGSIFGLDPTDVRAAACLSLMDLQRRAGGGRAAIVHFGSSAPSEYVTGPLDVIRDRRTLAAAASSPANLGGTSLLAPIVRGASLIPGARGVSKIVAYLLTDATEPIGMDVRLALAALAAKVEVHAVLINPPSGLADDWDSAKAFASVSSLSDPTVRAMATTLGASYAAALGAHLPTRKN